MENRQINFFKSKDFNTVLKPLKKGTVVKIDTFDIRESQKESLKKFMRGECSEFGREKLQ